MDDGCMGGWIDDGWMDGGWMVDGWMGNTQMTG